MEEVAKDLIVLGAINNGARQFKKISKVTKIKPEELNDVLEKLDLSKLANMDARKLSGGETQKLAIARTLVCNPELILLDEPTANLDINSTKSIEKIIQKISKETNITIILATHNLFQAKRIATKVGFLLNGKLIEYNTSKNIFDNPQKPETLSFIRGDF